MVVVGGGPAGAAAAISLARLGAAVTVLEAAPGPRSKVGESLSPGANPVLERLGLIDRLAGAALPSYGTCSRWGSDQAVEVDFVFGARGVGWRVDRLAFERVLADAARESGVHWCDDHSVVGLRRRRAPRGWTLEVATAAGPTTVSAEVVVDASGRAARLARLLGVRRVRYDRLVGAAFYCSTGEPGHGQAADPDEPAGDSTTLIEAVPDGWWYSLFLPGRRLVAAFLTDGDLLDDVGLRTSTRPRVPPTDAPATRSRLLTVDHRGWDGPHVRSANTSRLTTVAGEGWFAVGDAAFSVDPLASSGISSALGTGFYAAAATVEHLGGRADAHSAYAELVDHTFAQQLLLCHERYALERRWPEATFWRRRHQPRRTEPVVVGSRSAPGPAT